MKRSKVSNQRGAGHTFSPGGKGRVVAAAAALIGAALLGIAAPGAAQQAASSSATNAYGAADPLFQQPYIDIDEWREAPVRHHYMHGGFKGTNLKFSFYFPDKEKYQGRFFQYVAPGPGPEDAAERGTGENNRIAFSFDSGGYLVESNMDATNSDTSVTGFRASAAAADYSRVVAIKLFGGKRPYGYIYGGSGGGYRTMAAIENTTVWDGAVPYVIGSPRAMQVMVSGHSRATRVLKDKIPQIVDALDAGGSGNMYAGLTRDEADALREVTRFGFPPRAWVLTQGASGISRGPPGLPGTAIGPAYFSDFWTKSGFEGSDPTSFAARARIQFQTKVVKALTAEDLAQAGIAIPQGRGEGRGAAPGAPGAFVNPVGADLNRAGALAASPPVNSKPVALELESVPEKADLYGSVLLVKSGAATGKTIPLSRVVGKFAIAGGGGFGGGDSSALLAMLMPGDEIQIDNSDSLASEVYLRYQVPPTRDYYTWDQYRDAHGNPLYPQMPLSPESAIAGSVQNGKFKAKVIVVASLMDEMAIPWNADWYRNRVEQNLGPKLDNQFRLWYTDNAIHGDFEQSGMPTRIVSYLGVLYQALRDVSAWVEKGVPPPASTNYRIVDGQVIVLPTAAERRGIQPVVTLKANGGTRADVQVGQTVTFTGIIDVPAHTGKIVKAEWDFDGAGTFPVIGHLKASSPTRATVTATYSFSKPGTYFVALRATSQRDGDAQTLWGRIRNLARARVVVM
jgi:hypothetical protein